MGFLKVFITSPLKSSSEHVAQAIKKEKYDALFLDFHKDLEEYIYELGEGDDYKDIINEMVEAELIAEPSGAWLYWAKPVIRALQGIFHTHPNLEIFCTEEPYEHDYATSCKVDLAVLELKGRLGKIEIEEWKKLLQECVILSLNSSKKKLKFIAEKAKKYSRNLCFGFSSGKIKRNLEKEGMKVKIEYTTCPYFYTPIQVLQRMIFREIVQGKTVPNDAIEEIIKHDIEYVHNYVQTSNNVDEAYERWVTDKFKLGKVA